MGLPCAPASGFRCTGELSSISTGSGLVTWQCATVVEPRWTTQARTPTGRTCSSSKKTHVRPCLATIFPVCKGCTGFQGSFHRAASSSRSTSSLHPCVQANAKEASNPGTIPKKFPKYNPNRIIVKFKPTGLGPQAMAAARATTVSLPKGNTVEAALKAYKGRSGEAHTTWAGSLLWVDTSLAPMWCTTLVTAP